MRVIPRFRKPRIKTPGTERSYPVARLCSKCSVLEFSDRKFGVEELNGYESENKLTFDDDFPRRYPISKGCCALKVKLDYFHDDSLPDLEGLHRSAEAGCEFCHYLRESIQKATLEGKSEGRICIELFFYWRFRYAQQYGLNALVAQLHIQIDESEKEEFWESETFQDKEGYFWQRANSVVFKAESGHGNCQDWLQLEPSPRNEVLCTENVEVLRSLLDTCSGHCNHSQDTRLRPTRLLDLNALDTHDGIRLIETQSLNPADELNYAALSYCWGSEVDAAEQSITTTNNLGSRLADIHLNFLSRVMQDAVVATRSLGIRYLWIDSVCIIQDDLHDWERESTKMGLIYSNAFVTVAAIASSSCHEGFLVRSNSLPIKFRSSLRPSVQGTYQLRYHPCAAGALTLWKGRSFDRLYNVWSRRAWTLQEERLSTRLLLFGASRLALICANRESVEPFEGRLLSLKPTTILEDKPNGQVDITSSQRHLIYEKWIRLIRNYSHRNITDDNDIFPAVSGLAERVATATGDLYVAGLWKNYLPRGLEWSWIIPDQESLEDRIANLANPQETFICPSWSWAAARGGVEMISQREDWCDFRSECEVVSTWSDWASDLNPFGRIKHAELQIHGYLVPLPSDLYFDHLSESKVQMWKVDMSEHYTATVSLDWISSSDIQRLRGRLSMLLLSSWSVPLVNDSSYYNNSSQLITFNTTKSGIETDTADIKETELPEKSSDAIYRKEMSVHGKEAEVDMKDEYMDTGDCGLRTASDLENDEDRAAVGVLLHPASIEGKYVRVGVFYCDADKGGLKAFQNYEQREVHII